MNTVRFGSHSSHDVTFHPRFHLSNVNHSLKNIKWKVPEINKSWVVSYKSSFYLNTSSDLFLAIDLINAVATLGQGIVRTETASIVQQENLENYTHLASVLPDTCCNCTEPEILIPLSLSTMSEFSDNRFKRSGSFIGQQSAQVVILTFMVGLRQTHSFIPRFILHTSYSNHTSHTVGVGGVPHMFIEKL